MKPTETLASYVAEAKFTDFSQEVVLKAKQCILDNIGCALGGVQMDIGKQHVEVAKVMGGGAESTVIGDGAKVAMANAAYANAQLSNVLDFDDDVLDNGHPGGPFVQTVLAVGEQVGASGKDLITAVILSYEVALRVANALRSVVMPAGATHPNILLIMGIKALGTVTAAGKLLGLNREQILNAFGIAGTITPASSPPTWASKRLEMKTLKGSFGIYALLGILAALQAQKGHTGSPAILDGDAFWTKVGATSCDFAELTRGLGSEYLTTTKVGFKPTPSCRFTHPAITAVKAALKGDAVKVDDIEEIVLTGAQMLPTTTDWNTMLEAEFRPACSLSLYLAGVEPGPAWYQNGRMNEPDIRTLAKKFKFVDDLECWEQWVRYGEVHHKAEVKTKDGRIRTGQIEYLLGEPQNPMTEEELSRKFTANAVDIIGKEQSAKLLGRLLHLEDTNTSELMSLTHLT